MQRRSFQSLQRAMSLPEAGHGLVAHVDAAQASLNAGTWGAARRRGGAAGADSHRRAGWLRQFPPATGLRRHHQSFIQIWIFKLSPLPRVFNLTRREADMAIGVSQPTAGRLMVQRIADYRLHLAASTALWQSHKRPERLSDLKELAGCWLCAGYDL